MTQENDQPNVAIVSLKELLCCPPEHQLTIPTYQRPYKWTEKNVHGLIDDILYFADKSAYRLGTIVIHHDTNQNSFDIVDGQQRAITLYLIANAITTYKEPSQPSEKQDIFFNKHVQPIFNRNETIDNYKPVCLEKNSFSHRITKQNIQTNYQAILLRVKDFNSKTIDFFYNKCQVVRVIINYISQAFQFFDSQNARGKELNPHDLLKAFHLREMGHEEKSTREQAVQQWETTDTSKLISLFSDYLFRIKQWLRGNSASRYFLKEHIQIFKGVSQENDRGFPFAKIYNIADVFINDYNKSSHRAVEGYITTFPFQLDQPIFNGKRFFEMVAYYHALLNKITSGTITDSDSDAGARDILHLITDYSGKHRVGDGYVRILFYCALLCYVDRFGTTELQTTIEKLFVWAYSIRLQKKRVQWSTVNNYAISRDGLHLFHVLKYATHPRDVLNLRFKKLYKNEDKNDVSYDVPEIVKKFEELGYYVK